MMTSSVASECFIVTGLHASRELEIVSESRRWPAPESASSWPGPTLQASPRAGGGTGLQASIQNLLRKGTKGPLHYQGNDEKPKPSSRLRAGAMSSIPFRLPRPWDTSLDGTPVTAT